MRKTKTLKFTTAIWQHFSPWVFDIHRWRCSRIFFGVCRAWKKLLSCILIKMAIFRVLFTRYLSVASRGRFYSSMSELVSTEISHFTSISSTRWRVFEGVMGQELEERLFLNYAINSSCLTFLPCTAWSCVGCLCLWEWESQQIDALCSEVQWTINVREALGTD